MNRIALLAWKKIVFTFFCLLFLQCSKNNIERNPFLPELRFSVPVNLNLPQYDNLRYAGGSVLLPQYGHHGILVFNLNGSTYIAWEASCPNHLPNNCSQTELQGVLSVCRCEDYQYSLATGQLLNPPSNSERFYSLINYQVSPQGSSLVISN